MRGLVRLSSSARLHWLIAAALLPFWAHPVVVEPVLHWSRGTSVNMQVDVLAEPYREAPALIYRWRGDVLRACPVRIERWIVDAQGFIHTLEVTNYPVPDRLGHVENTITVQTPLSLPAGKARYHAIERPACTWVQRLWRPKVPYPVVHFTVTK